MAQKLKLDSVSEGFIHKKTSKSQNTKTAKHQKVLREQQTVYLTPGIRKLARIHSAETNERISDLIERLLTNFFNKKKK